MENRKEWRLFFLSEIFPEIKRGKRLKSDDHIEGQMPYVSSTAENNGVDDFISNDQNVRIFSNCISFANSGSVGSAFYEPFPFVASDHITHLKNDSFDEDICLFLIAALGKLAEKYNFNREINDYRISREKIMLPVTDDGKPDYEYMAGYIQGKQANILKQYMEYISAKLDELGEPVKIPALDEKKWEKYIIESIFDILPGKRLVAANSTPGGRPFIGASDKNNGITRFCGEKNASLDRNVLGINYNGSVGSGFYHPYECIFSDDVKRFHLKDHEDNAYVLLFMEVAISSQSSKFGYAYKFNAERMSQTKILLPVDEEGNPDYEYMEQYIKNMMICKYQQYIQYLQQKEIKNNG